MAVIADGDRRSLACALGDDRGLDRRLLVFLASRVSVPAWLLLACIVLAEISPIGRGLAAAQFRADDWITECQGGGPGAGCSIIMPFQPTSARGATGSFALAVDIESGVAALVGRPPPLAARLQIDKNQPLGCTGPRYCLFAAGGASSAASQLAAGSIALIDIATKAGDFHASLSTKGYRAGLAKIRAWSYPPIGRGRPVR